MEGLATWAPEVVAQPLAKEAPKPMASQKQPQGDRTNGELPATSQEMQAVSRACSQNGSLSHGPLAGPANKPCTSSQRSAGTVSGADGGEVAPLPTSLVAATSLKRSLEEDADSQTSSQGCSKSQRSSLEATPARRAAAEKARQLWAADEAAASADEAADSADDGLEFLLRACEMLDPSQVQAQAGMQAGSSMMGGAAGGTRAAAMPSPSPSKRGIQALEGTPKITRQARHAGTASLDSSPQVLSGARRPVSRRLLAREAAADLEGGADPYGSDYDGGDADADYQPSGAGRPLRTSTRAQRASARGVAAAAATAPGGAAAPAPAAAATASSAGGGGGRWSGEPKALVNGPCMNPDCEHPHDSPQWRKGPPQHPVLCNACGTRWLRNGTLKPLVPRRGLRYKNKPKPAPKGKAAAAAAQAAAAAAAAQAAVAVVPPAAVPPPVPAPAQHKQLPVVAGTAQPAHSSDVSDGPGASEAEDPTALFSQQASMQLPMPAPLQAGVPFMPAMAAFGQASMAAFGPAMFGNMHPAAAAAAAAEALKNAPHLFAAASLKPVQPTTAMFPPMVAPVLTPWGFFAQHPAAPQPPALFQPAPQPTAEAAPEQQQQEPDGVKVQDGQQCSQQQQQQHAEPPAAAGAGQEQQQQQQEGAAAAAAVPPEMAVQSEAVAEAALPAAVEVV